MERVSFVYLNLGGLSVPGVLIGMCHWPWILWMWVFTMRGLCRVNQIFIITVVWLLPTVSSCSLGRKKICSTSRELQSGTGGSIVGRAHSLRPRHEDTSFHARMAQSTFLIVWVKIRIRWGRIRGLGVCWSTSPFGCKPRVGHPRVECWLQIFRWHLSA